MNLFPNFPLPQLSRDDVVRYLTERKAEGHQVYQHPVYGHAFILVLSEDARLTFVLNEPIKTCQVQGEKLGEGIPTRNVETIGQLERAVAQAAADCGHSWPFRPTTGRLSADTPATNYRTIAQLVGSSLIEAAFDPYLDNSALAALINILSFGSGGVADGVRLLGSTKKTTGSIPKFSRAGVDAWLTQLGITGEARVMLQTDEHRRFLLLSGGQSLILGMSLNAIHKNEAVRLEPDTADRAFFDGVWATATPLA
jgi:hypothetical protein